MAPLSAKVATVMCCGLAADALPSGFRFFEYRSPLVLSR